MHRSAPLPEKRDECFASYGFHDAYDTWISYGFVDADVPFVQSLPITLDAPQSWNNSPRRNTRGARERRKGAIKTVGAAVIPGPQAPRALSRTLRVLISELGALRQQHRPSRDVRRRTKSSPPI